MFKKEDHNQHKLDHQAFATFNQQLFHDPTIPPDHFSHLQVPEDHIITAEELTHVTAKHFHANKSSGLSPLPLQLIKHIGPAGNIPMARFLNESAIFNHAPQTWRNSKIIPLYKNKGSPEDMNNYRSIAIPPPFTKILMATINQRITHHAETNHLHAPTQAGFRAHHTTTEQALIL